MKNPAAQALGRLARGKRKTLTEEQRTAQRARMQRVNEARRKAAA